MSNNKFKFAALQLSITSDKTKNLNRAQSLIEEAVKKGAKIVALPECFNCPYGHKYFPTYAEDLTQSQTATMLQETAKANNIYLIGGSIPEKEGGKLYNTSLTFGPNGKLLAKHRKVHLFDIDVPGKITFKESDSLTPGNSVTTFDTEFCKIGVAICYDIRFPELAHLMEKQGCKMICYPGAFNLTTGPKHWELLTRARAVDNQVFVATISPARDVNADYVAWGHSTITSPWGEVIAKAGAEEEIIYADIDLDTVSAVRDQIPVLKQKRVDLYSVVQPEKA